jgi:hypothetical protein
MGTIRDVNKIVVSVKVVPDAEPNHDGWWQTVDVHEYRLQPKTDWNYLNTLVPAGHHVVQVNSGVQ